MKQEQVQILEFDPAMLEQSQVERRGTLAAYCDKFSFPIITAFLKQLIIVLALPNNNDVIAP